ncbi:hypothetical protein GCM10008018_25310 [Paenibacillus marchantiophytorum]|uniref:Uncharacterized protein n=1 Tax=Paenibacillus marchantiophytorum TaxID=1619310 RepID=A0ABQ1EMG9_9BACL|nr:hypothetical protein [Paenibacillus marchantiophytorum]GFZ78725.1 hypothetical protein GCM10008018_25310 [Paenibacillus marchantiophytorum]
MHYSLWSYPWDLLDIGIDEAMAEISQAHLTGISLTTSYHAGRFLQPRSPKRKVYFPEDGTLYFPFRKEKYRSLLIQPTAASLIKEHPNFWDHVFESANKRNLKVSGWTVCLHNTKLGMEFPDVTVKNAFGDAYYYNLCPSHEEVRRYMKAMIEDLTDQYPFHALELESLNYMGFPHEFHHEKDGVGLSERDQFLLSLCFCDACKSRSTRDGVDITHAERTVRKWIMEFCENEVPIQDDNRFMQLGLNYFDDYPEVTEFLCWRSTVVTSLAQELQEIMPAKTQLYFLSLLTPSKSWLFGVDLHEISQVNDGIVVCCYDTEPLQVGIDIAQSKETVMTNCLFAGLRVFYPEVQSKEELIDKILRAKLAGTDGYLFYNYGLIPKKRMDWIREAIETVSSMKFET